MSEHETEAEKAKRKHHIDRTLKLVEEGKMSVRRAAQMLDWTADDVQLAVWGEIRL